MSVDHLGKAVVIYTREFKYKLFSASLFTKWNQI